MYKKCNLGIITLFKSNGCCNFGNREAIDDFNVFCQHLKHAIKGLKSAMKWLRRAIEWVNHCLQID
jgi:hypothetical protein